MEQLNVGTRGAKFQSWAGRNPRDLLKTILDENPGSDRLAVFRLFRERLKEDDAEDYVETIVDYWLANNYHSLVGSPAASARVPRNTRTLAQNTEALRGAITKKIAQRAKIVLLEMMMPNGKPLKDCTGADCRKLSERIGDWLSQLGTQLKPRQRVGDVFTEDELQSLY